MALSMEEQRILAEIEDELSRSEPVLAACLSMFSRPGRMGLLRASHARRHSPRVSSSIPAFPRSRRSSPLPRSIW